LSNGRRWTVRRATHTFIQYQFITLSQGKDHLPCQRFESHELRVSAKECQTQQMPSGTTIYVQHGRTEIHPFAPEFLVPFAVGDFTMMTMHQPPRVLTMPIQQNKTDNTTVDTGL
jgi:hypothetical protein